MMSVFKEVAELMAGLKHRGALTGAGISAGTGLSRILEEIKKIVG